MPVQTVRYIIQDSIEQNMLKIQQRKMDLAKCAILALVFTHTRLI